MGIFIFFGLCTLLVAKIMLFAKILWTRNCTGISGKTQVLYAIIFAGRFLDIVTTYYTCPLNVSLSRIAFIAVTYCTVLSIYFIYNKSYQRKYDSFRIELLILPCIVLSLLANYGFTITEVFWAFSIYLESVAIIPQMYLISRMKHTENIVYYYISVLSIYKVFHLMDGIYKFYMNERYDRISLAAGVVQLMFYCDFFMRDVPLKGDVRGTDEEAGIEDSYTKNLDSTIYKNTYSKELEIDNDKHNNLKEVVLTPASLVKDKKNNLESSDENVEAKESKDTTLQIIN